MTLTEWEKKLGRPITIDEWAEIVSKSTVRERMQGKLNRIRMKIGTAFLGDLLSYSIQPQKDGPAKFILIDTRRRLFYGPWYVKQDFLGSLLLCRSPLYEQKIPTCPPSSQSE